MNRVWMLFTVVALAIAVVPLASILIEVVSKGISSINLDFFTQKPPLVPPYTGGGMGPAIQGTLILVAISSAVGIPIGLISGIYTAEYGANNRYGKTVRFLGDVLAGIPSITTGVLVYSLVIVPLQSPGSAIAGSVALGSMMIPIISNTSAEALKAVPNSIREASHSLGVRKWRTTLLVVANARKSIATASLLGIARITGETAPLILTVGISSQWFGGFNQPVATLTYYIYYFAINPVPQWQALAWGAAFILIVIVLGINLGVRVVTRGKKVYA